MQTAPQAGPCTLVIFGASGDLTKRLLLPALFHLRRAGLLPEDFAILGVARRPKSDEIFRAEMAAAVKSFSGDFSSGDWQWLAQRLYYQAGVFEDDAAYAALAKRLGEIDAKHRTGGNYLFYLATPPTEFVPIVQHLGASGLARADGSWRRVVVEKPFGTDFESARALNRVLLGVLDESQIYRIDHYLGKETVQNIMVLRFGNGIFESLWNRQHIDHIEITVAEDIGIEGRGAYYDATGALRDMVPNHLFQLLTLTAMEPPTCFEANALRSEKGKVLDAVRHFDEVRAAKHAVRAQYGAGTAGAKRLAAYANEPGIGPDSRTETYAALKLTIDNWRWAGVPFYLRTGKALAERKSEIVVQFQRAPLTLFHGTPVDALTPNDMVLHIQPQEGVSLRFGAKVPGPRMRIGDVDMTFNYRDYFHKTASNGYETLLYDCMIGDAALFQRADTIEAAWGIIQPVLDLWQQDKSPIPVYGAGSEGPPQADALVAADGRRWRAIGAGEDADTVPRDGHRQIS